MFNHISLSLSLLLLLLLLLLSLLLLLLSSSFFNYFSLYSFVFCIFFYICLYIYIFLFIMIIINHVGTRLIASCPTSSTFSILEHHYQWLADTTNQACYRQAPNTLKHNKSDMLCDSKRMYKSSSPLSSYCLFVNAPVSCVYTYRLRLEILHWQIYKW